MDPRILREIYQTMMYHLDIAERLNHALQILRGQAEKEDQVPPRKKYTRKNP